MVLRIMKQEYAWASATAFIALDVFTFIAHESTDTAWQVGHHLPACMYAAPKAFQLCNQLAIFGFKAGFGVVCASCEMAFDAQMLHTLSPATLPESATQLAHESLCPTKPVHDDLAFILLLPLNY